MFAIARYGSSIRKDDDQFSDRDLLITCPSYLKTKLVEKYKKDNYSVSYFTPAQLTFMATKGSLFLQHLKSESLILLDDNCDFKNYLENIKFIKPTDDEINSVKSSLEFLFSWPCYKSLLGWKADYMYCLIRDLLIKSNAQNGVVCFSINGLIEIFRESMGIDLAKLQDLRRIKAAFRNNDYLPDSTSSIVSELETLVIDAFALKSTKWSGIDLVEQRQFISNHEQLRVIEAFYLLLRSEGFIHHEHELLVKVITEPNNYGSTQMRNKQLISNYLKDLSQKLNSKPINLDKLPINYALLTNR